MPHLRAAPSANTHPIIPRLVGKTRHHVSGPSDRSLRTAGIHRDAPVVDAVFELQGIAKKVRADGPSSLELFRRRCGRAPLSARRRALRRARPYLPASGYSRWRPPKVTRLERQSRNDRWAQGRVLLRAADDRMAALVDADPALDPDAFFDSWPSDVWSALMVQVIGQELSLAAAAAIRGRLAALQAGRLPTPAEILALDDQTLRGVGLSRAKVVYLHDLAARVIDGRLDFERLRRLDDDAARDALTQVKGVGRFTADGVLLLALRRTDVWPAADLALRRAAARVWGLDPPASIAEVDSLGERFRPWRTLAAVYLLTSRPPAQPSGIAELSRAAGRSGSR